ncbi:TonB-dependent receptor [Novosphingobium profundi]|uniref:TonB-dependent receptor domain-containing protein n=1 Tax=Novosphingobium profundi TaxID=1774954 RepID=UPI001BDA614B|nr:TonB-dependent receptor [Novosphingobium profundi]MBT0670455.1 TonB-dependent receptor [Novosphingobium profundi]
MTNGAESTSPQRSTTEEIVVTGSLIARNGFDTPTPVTAISAEDLQRTAAPDIADVINQMPSVRPSLTPASTGNLSSMATGNYLDLRGLGYLRTLVLVDGHRYVPSTPNGGINISSIPQALVKSVDIVTGGASATYGSDAVAGAVNIKIDDAFEGIKGKLQGGITDHNDYRNFLGSLAYGTRFADGRMRLVVAADVAQNGGIDSIGDRDWGNNPARISNPAYTASNDEPRYLLVSNAHSANASYGGVINSPGALSGIQFAADGSAIPFTYGSLVSSSSMVGGDGSNSTADNVGAVPYTRYNGFGRLTFEASDALTLFTEFSYSKTTSRYPTLARKRQYTISVDNPFIPDSVRDVMLAEGISSFVMGRSLNDFARNDLRINIATLQSVTGAQGRFGDGWTWDAYYSFGRTKNVLKLEQYITERFNLALDAVTDPDTGAAVCRSTLTDPDNGCVPINLIGEGNVSQAALNYINGTSQREWDIRQHVLSGTLHGQPFSTWAGPVGIAVGAEYRRSSVDTTSDAISQAQGYLGGGTMAYSGKVEVKEAFGEILVPLAADQPWARDLSLNVAGRVTDYSTSGTVETWKAGLNYAVNDSVRLRLTRSRDIRAPGLEELYAAGSTSSLSVTDPELEGASYTVQALNTGNPDLTPEKADTFTAGLILTPGFVPGLKLSIDYYDIKLKNAIISLTPATIVEQCYSTAPQLCSLITRGEDGAITSVLNGPVNLQRVQERGIDFEGSYSLALGTGQLGMRALVTYIDKAQIYDGTTTTDLVDAVNQPTIAALGGNPRWRFNTSASYATGQWRLSLGARYVGGGRIDPDYTEKDIDVLRVNGRLYFDLSGEMTVFDRGSDKIVLYGSVQNLFDQDPPITGVGGYGTTRSLYDTIGRVYTMGVRFQL